MPFPRTAVTSFQGQIHRVPDAGVHALPANGAMKVSRVANEKGAATAEELGNAMVHPVGREPVDPIDRHFHPLDRVAAHIVPAEVVLPSSVLFHGSDQPRGVLSFHGKDRKKTGIVERDVELMVIDGPAEQDIGDIEDVCVGSPSEPRAEHLPHLGVTAIAAGEIGRFALGLSPFGVPQSRRDGVTALLETKQLGSAFDLDALLTEVVDRKAVVTCKGLAEKICPSLEKG